MNNWEYDFGLNDKEFGLGLGKKPRRQFDPKDPYGMNAVADDMKQDLAGTVKGIGKDVKQFKDEVSPLYNQAKGFFDKRKAQRQVKNIRVFGQNVKNRRKEQK